MESARVKNSGFKSVLNASRSFHFVSESVAYVLETGVVQKPRVLRVVTN